MPAECGHFFLFTETEFLLSMNTKTRRGTGEQPHYRLLVLSRIVAAVAGGYAFATVMILVLTYLLPLPQKDALMLSTMLSYIIYLLAIIWAFSVKTVRKAWIGISVATGLLGALAFLLHSIQQ